jgi:hypothetical protein
MKKSRILKDFDELTIGDTFYESEASTDACIKVLYRDKREEGYNTVFRMIFSPDVMVWVKIPPKKRGT